MNADEAHAAFEMGVIAAKSGCTPESVGEVIGLGAMCQNWGVSAEDVRAVWRLKMRALAEAEEYREANPR